MQKTQTTNHMDHEDMMDNYLSSNPKLDLSVPGTPVLLSNCFIGGPQFMQLNYKAVITCECAENMRNPCGSWHSWHFKVERNCKELA